MENKEGNRKRESRKGVKTKRKAPQALKNITKMILQWYFINYNYLNI